MVAQLIADSVTARRVKTAADRPTEELPPFRRQPQTEMTSDCSVEKASQSGLPRPHDL